jgi:hypothetical protein
VRENQSQRAGESALHEPEAPAGIAAELETASVEGLGL